MALAVVTVAAGGLPVIDVTAAPPKLALPVTEATNGYGIPVTKVSPLAAGLAVTFTAVTLQRRAAEDDGDQPLAEQGA